MSMTVENAGGPRPATTAATRLLGVLGWPVSHSLSPAIHSVAIAEQGLDAVYLAFPVHPSRLLEALRGLDAAGALGLSVTAPHKESALSLLSRATELARGVGAVNTIFRGGDGTLIGDNTDVGGLQNTLAEAGPELAGRHAVVVGAGGAAAAAVVALARRGAGKVTVLARREERAEALIGRIGESGLCGGVVLEVAPLREQARVLADAGALVQATSAPISEGPAVDPGLCPAGALALEMAYEATSPCETAFLTAARRAGLHAVDGLRILLHQGVLAWERWTKEPLEPSCIKAMFEISRSYRRVS